ncbi:MAG: hypothetical protein U5R31_08380 [Acidimicrobiia bacterium]|nr:hypothetical protein [Acidimicrobiia bacterium]
MSSSPEAPSIAEWWTLVEQGDVAVLEPLDYPGLPQRASAVEWDRHEVRDQLGQLVLGAGLGAPRCGAGAS